MSAASDDWNELPLLLTVDEAAHVLRIGRSHAYNLTKLYETSHGTAGVPVIRLGDLLRIPKSALQELLTTGHIVQLRQDATTAMPSSSRAKSSRQRSTTTERQQLSLIAD
ncbi:MAG: helix-turn-helix domain-containing protein [Ilumatobacteraceae bacterium]